MRIIKTTLDNILSLISCARDYGFEDNVLFDAFAAMLNHEISNDEIEKFAKSIESQDGYGHEDYKSIKECLIEFKNEYCNQN